jgi:hypothetical protein
MPNFPSIISPHFVVQKNNVSKRKGLYIEAERTPKILTGTATSGAVTVTTNIISSLTTNETDESGKACRTSPSNECVCKKSIRIPLEAKR